MPFVMHAWTCMYEAGNRTSCIIIIIIIIIIITAQEV